MWAGRRNTISGNVVRFTFSDSQITELWFTSLGRTQGKPKLNWNWHCPEWSQTTKEGYFKYVNSKSKLVDFTAGPLSITCQRSWESGEVPIGKKSDSVFLIYRKSTREDTGITDLIAWESFLKLTFILASVQCVQTLITPLKARDTYVSFIAKTSGVVASSREKPST